MAYTFVNKVTMLYFVNKFVVRVKIVFALTLL